MSVANTQGPTDALRSDSGHIPSSAPHPHSVDVESNTTVSVQIPAQIQMKDSPAQSNTASIPTHFEATSGMTADGMTSSQPLDALSVPPSTDSIPEPKAIDAKSSPSVPMQSPTTIRPEDQPAQVKTEAHPTHSETSDPASELASCQPPDEQSADATQRRCSTPEPQSADFDSSVPRQVPAQIQMEAVPSQLTMNSVPTHHSTERLTALEIAADLPASFKGEEASSVDMKEDLNGGPHPEQFCESCICTIACIASGQTFLCPIHFLALVGLARPIQLFAGRGRMCMDPNAVHPLFFCIRPLHWAAMFGQLDAFKALVEAGAEPFPGPDCCHNTPMTVAARHKHPHVTRFLCSLLDQMPPAPAAKLAHSPRNLVLVGCQSPKRLLFQSPSALRAGSEVRWCLQGRESAGVGLDSRKEKRQGQWRVLTTKTVKADNAVQVRYDGNFVWLVGHEFVLDVEDARYTPGAVVNFVAPAKHAKTAKKGGGRDWDVNEDGSVSLKKFPQLVLGFR